jgi:molecular chaperone DnaK (HSP70)
MKKKKIVETGPKKIIGIDLGTCFSEVAHLTDAGAVEIIPNQDGDTKTPSIVSWAGRTPVVGKAARPDLAFAPEFVLQCAKRSMGKTTADGKPIPIGRDRSHREITPVDSSAAILGNLKQCAENYLGCEISQAVITVPAYFDSIARDNTVAAAKIAGFSEVRILNEPEAAALYYSLEKGTNQTIVVVDTGGGTTDVTAVEINGGSVKTLLTDGDAELGGSNYDEVVLELMVQEGKSKGIEISAEKDLATFYQNLDRAREAKEMLSRREEVTVIIEGSGQRTPLKLTRPLLRQVAKALDDRFVNCCRRVHEGLKAKGKTIDRVLLVGGNSRQPHIAELVQSVFGLEPAKDTDPDLVVAKGAAIGAAICFGEKGQNIVVGSHRYLAQEIQMQTVAAHALCVAARKHQGDPQEYNCAIVPAGTALPHDFEERFAPVDPGQREVMIKIVQGKPGEPSSNAPVLREIRVPIAPSDQDQDRIRVKGRYTAEGLLELTIMDDLSGQMISDSFVHQPGLSRAEIEQKRCDLAGQAGGA